MLIVMFILVVPAMTNEVPISLPRGPRQGLPLTTHRLTVARNGALALDGEAVSDTALTGRLGAVVCAEQATLVMRTDPQTRYKRFVQVLAVVKRAGVTRVGIDRQG